MEQDFWYLARIHRSKELAIVSFDSIVANVGERVFIGSNSATVLFSSKDKTNLISLKKQLETPCVTLCDNSLSSSSHDSSTSSSSLMSPSYSPVNFCQLSEIINENNDVLQTSEEHEEIKGKKNDDEILIGKKPSVKRKLFSDDSTSSSKYVTKNVRTKNYPTKNNFCVFCKSFRTKIARHFVTVHKNEPDVKEIIKLPLGCRERAKGIEILRKKGNYEYNSSNVQNPDRDLVVSRRPHTRIMDPSNFKPCPSCKGYYSVKSLRQHYYKCADKPKGTRCIIVNSRAIAREIHPKACAILREYVVPVMREDDICKAIRYDEIAITYGNRLCLKYKSHHHHDMIRSRLRLIGRFLLALRSITPLVTDLASIFTPFMYEYVEKAINIVGRLDTSQQKYAAPATAFALGNLIKDCTKMFITECVKNENRGKKEKAKDFLKVLESELNCKVNKTVSENTSERSRQKKVILPLTEDIKKLRNFLENKMMSYLQEIKENGFIYPTWRNLLEATLVAALIFNRRRPGELERTTIADYESYCCIDENTNKELFDSLSEDAKECARHFIRFKIRGKKGKTVPVLLDQIMKLSVECIIRYRNQASVPEDNPYIFGIQQTKDYKKTFKYVRAYRLLQKYASECGAHDPQTLKATELRKHIATTSIQLNLSDSDIAGLQDFMGHTDKTHRLIYRQQLIQRDVVNVSKLLCIAQGSKGLSSFKNAPIEKNKNNSNNVANFENEQLPLLADTENANTSETNDQISIEEFSEGAPKTNNIVVLSLENSNEIDNTDLPVYEVEHDGLSTTGINDQTSTLHILDSRADETQEVLYLLPFEDIEGNRPNRPETNELTSTRNILENTNATNDIVVETTENLEEIDGVYSLPIEGPKKLCTSVTNGQISNATNQRSGSEISNLKSSDFPPPSTSKIVRYDISATNSEDSSSDNDLPESENNDDDGDENLAKRNSKGLSRKSNKNTKRMAWETPEKNIILKCFSKHINNGKVPSNQNCRNLIEKHTELGRRSVNQIKAFVNYAIKKKASARSGEIKKVFWTTPEKKKIYDVFGDHLKNRKYPSIAECQAAVKQHKELKLRSPMRIRSFIQNLYRKKTVLSDAI